MHNKLEKCVAGTRRGLTFGNIMISFPHGLNKTMENFIQHRRLPGQYIHSGSPE